MKVRNEVHDDIFVVTITRPEVRNCVDRETADALAGAFRRFDEDEALRVAILQGEGGCFCAGADLKAVGEAGGARANRVLTEGDGPMGPTRMLLGKPVIAAVEGYAVAGGLELALWCDLRVAARDAVFGVYCRRWGVPLIDGGTIRLPRLIGHSHAMDMILTGRGVSGEEAQSMGLANRLVSPGEAFDQALARDGALAPAIGMTESAEQKEKSPGGQPPGLIRSQMLYPAELRTRMVQEVDASTLSASPCSLSGDLKQTRWSG